MEKQTAQDSMNGSNALKLQVTSCSWWAICKIIRDRTLEEASRVSHPYVQYQGKLKFGTNFGGLKKRIRRGKHWSHFTKNPVLPGIYNEVFTLLSYRRPLCYRTGRHRPQPRARRCHWERPAQSSTPASSFDPPASSSISPILFYPLCFLIHAHILIHARIVVHTCILIHPGKNVSGPFLYHLTLWCHCSTAFMFCCYIQWLGKSVASCESIKWPVHHARHKHLFTFILGVVNGLDIV